MKIIINNMKLSSENKEKILKKAQQAYAEVIFTSNDEEAVKAVEEAEILFGEITPEIFSKAKKLKWIQAPVASLGQPTGEYYVFPELAESDVILTNMSGIYSDIISIHVFAFITCFACNFPMLIRNQTRKIWDEDTRTTNLLGKTLGIVGLGGIGKEVARIGKAFGMRIVAVEPNTQKIPSYIKKIWKPHDVKKLMMESDFVVLCLPDAPGTVNMIGLEELKAMKRTAYLINIGRGRTVELDALTQTLKNKEIAGAGLDVFPPEFEPLPQDHPLWTMENVIITPHCAGHGTPIERRIDVFLENFDRYINDKSLLNLVDKKKMIRIGLGYNLPS